MAVRPHPLENGRWWDATVNTVGGCDPPSRGCLNCYAARNAGTLQASTGTPLYEGTTTKHGDRYAFNGKLTVLPDDHPTWRSALDWKGADEPLLGPGMPSLLWASDMAELFLPGRGREDIDRTIGTLVISRHIGLILTKQPEAMVKYILSQPEFSLQRWRAKLWLGFSAEDQRWFDERWPPMRMLAERGFLVFVSIAPMLAPVRLSDDFLTQARWVIVGGEQGLQHHVRAMRPGWARGLRDQCAAAGIPFFMKQMAGKRPIPPDLCIREFPRL
jgi:protein gp37